MSSGQSLMEAFTSMMVCLLLGLLLTISFGVTTDIMREQYLINGFYNISGAWAAVSNVHSIDVLNDIIYIMCYFIPTFGVINFIVTAVRRQKYDQYGNSIDD
jgi:hypothetical protein